MAGKSARASERRERSAPSRASTYAAPMSSLGRHTRGTLRSDSRQVQPGDAFLAWPGAATDGRLYLKSALQQGAAACLLAEEGAEPWQALSDADQAEHKLARLACMADLKAQTTVQRPAVLLVHSDYTVNSGPQRVRDILRRDLDEVMRG